MKKIIIAALLFAGMSTYAQDTTASPKRAKMERITPEERQEKQLKRLTADLSLNSDQQLKVKQLLADQALLRENKVRPKEGSAEEIKNQRMALKDNRQINKKVLDEKMKVILTPEQFSKWKTNQQKMEEKTENRVKDRRNGKL